MILILNVILVLIMSMIMGILWTIARLVMIGDTLRDLSYCSPFFLTIRSCVGHIA